MCGMYVHVGWCICVWSCTWDDAYVCGIYVPGVHTCSIPGTCSKYSSLSAPETKQQLADDTLYLSSLEHVLKDISEVYALESVVSHMDLGYSGTVDCIGKYK